MIFDAASDEGRIVIALCDERARLIADVERLTRERDEQKAKKKAAWARGAAVAFGLMGMAEAIRANAPRACEVCGKSVSRWSTVCSFDCVVAAERRMRPPQARGVGKAVSRNVVLVCGGRDYARAAHVWSVLDQLHEYIPITHLVEGGATGADGAARGWAMSRGVPNTTVHANWREHGRAAGPIRNQKMLDEYEPTYVIAFPGGRGTKDMTTRARACGYRVEMHQPDKDDDLCLTTTQLSDQEKADK